MLVADAHRAVPSLEDGLDVLEVALGHATDNVVQFVHFCLREFGVIEIEKTHTLGILQSLLHLLKCK
jgi:hypothetical protein